LLFILFINDDFPYSKSLLILLNAGADDLKIFFHVGNKNDFANGQDDFVILSIIDSGMQLILGKCASMSFARFCFTERFSIGAIRFQAGQCEFYL
jgi:hypothetical protein